MHIETLLRTIKKNYPKADLKLVRKAYSFAENLHKGQKRATGEEFIEHPMEVAKILAEHSLDLPTIIAGLLHDTIEDTQTSYDVIKNEFGEEIAQLVEGVTKISKLKITDWETRNAENVRKMIMASTKDIRVIFIRLADKLHNIRTINAFREEKRKRIAQAIIDVYAPIAYKLGISSIKNELENLAFEQLNPGEFNKLKRKVKKSIKQHEKEIEELKSELLPILQKEKIKIYKIFGRTKTIYSLYKKIQRKNCKFEDIFDLMALRIIAKSVKECYEIIGIIHNLWKPLPHRFKDFIAMPKSNMYQSLHTTVMVKGQPIEIQVRTEEMDKIAEDGIAAHWQYKGIFGAQEFDAKLSWLKQILEWQKELRDSKEFMEMLQVDFFEDEIHVFTPKGEVISLPKGSCVLDFAYAVHTNVGSTCTGARVNAKFVPLRTELKNGNQVEIITSKNQKPSREWLKFVKTPKARTKIKQIIREIEKIPVKSYSQKIVCKKEGASSIIDVIGVKDPEVNLAKCCGPLPGDEIVAFATSTGKVAVHKKGCFNIKKLKEGKRKDEVEVTWIDAADAIVEIKVEMKNRVGIFSEILNSIVATKTQIKSTSAKSISNTMMRCGFSIEAKGLTHIRDIIRRIKKIKDVNKVFIGSLEK
ncbi:MAG: bifunctional (p)ppGpp synthetase/guanosine-3',5'-bis(diphosphate) 3'-pyrophosphohydrolase [Nanoarchaeota archaeon]|nr:bifunctional (p)ppGpp synthetase/guanosine-3',5'-bis(diphosphate) 3'-pyrophosphohydrolase [Nanoarchaeota archaeon]